MWAIDTIYNALFQNFKSSVACSYSIFIYRSCFSLVLSKRFYMLETIYMETFFAARSNLVKFAVKITHIQSFFFLCIIFSSHFLIIIETRMKMLFLCLRLEDNASDSRTWERTRKLSSDCTHSQGICYVSVYQCPTTWFCNRCFSVFFSPIKTDVTIITGESW